MSIKLSDCFNELAVFNHQRGFVHCQDITSACTRLYDGYSLKCSSIKDQFALDLMFRRGGKHTKIYRFNSKKECFTSLKFINELNQYESYKGVKNA